MLERPDDSHNGGTLERDADAVERSNCFASGSLRQIHECAVHTHMLVSTFNKTATESKSGSWHRTCWAWKRIASSLCWETDPTDDLWSSGLHRLPRWRPLQSECWLSARTLCLHFGQMKKKISQSLSLSEGSLMHLECIEHLWQLHSGADANEVVPLHPPSSAT